MDKLVVLGTITLQNGRPTLLSFGPFQYLTEEGPGFRARHLFPYGDPTENEVVPVSLRQRPCHGLPIIIGVVVTRSNTQRVPVHLGNVPCQLSSSTAGPQKVQTFYDRANI